MSDFAREVLQGAYDLHIHFGPASAMSGRWPGVFWPPA